LLRSGVPAMLLLCGIASKLTFTVVVKNLELPPVKLPLPLAGEGWGGGRQQRQGNVPVRPQTLPP